MQPGALSPAVTWRRKAVSAALWEFFQRSGARPAENPCPASGPPRRAQEFLPIANSARVVLADRASAPVLLPECPPRVSVRHVVCRNQPRHAQDPLANL